MITSFRLGIYEAIRRTAEAQREAVKADDLDAFYALLQERERLLDKTEAVEQELEPADRERATSVVGEIMRVDHETERLLMSKIEVTRDELADMAVGKRAVAAYGQIVPLR